MEVGQGVGCGMEATLFFMFAPQVPEPPLQTHVVLLGTDIFLTSAYHILLLVALRHRLGELSRKEVCFGSRFALWSKA